MAAAGTGSAGKKVPLKLSKLGAVKKEGNFDEIAAQANREPEPAAQLSRISSMSPPAAQPKIALDAPSSGPSKASEPPGQQFMARSAPVAAGPSQPKPGGPAPVSLEQQAAMERLGIGMRKLNQSQTTHAAGRPPAPAETSQTAKYSSKAMSEASKETKVVTGLKSMSSDQYFKQGTEEQDLNSERLRSIQGKTSVSSGQFFKNRTADEGSDDDEEEFYEPAGASGILSRIQRFIEQELLGEEYDGEAGQDEGAGDAREARGLGGSPTGRQPSSPRPDRRPR